VVGGALEKKKKPGGWDSRGKSIVLRRRVARDHRDKKETANSTAQSVAKAQRTRAELTMGRQTLLRENKHKSWERKSKSS